MIINGSTKKLIEIALPLEAINKEALRRKQKAPKGWPASFHKWWSQKPLAIARAIIFAQMVDDPASRPDLHQTLEAQDKERERLFRIIEELVLWDNTNNEDVLERARTEIQKSWQHSCKDFADHPHASKLFDENVLPAFDDPFSGSGALPLSAQWLGLDSYASDLNPVAVLINLATLEIPPIFAGQSPVNSKFRQSESFVAPSWRGAQGMAEDVRHYGYWMREEAEKRIGSCYPKIAITTDMAYGRADLQPYVGRSLTVTAWIWARTVKSPNPAFASIDVPLTSTFVFSSKDGKEAYVEPVIDNGHYKFRVKVGKPDDVKAAQLGTSAGKQRAFRCLMSNVPISYDYIRDEGSAGRMSARLMAIVAEGERGRVYLTPTPEHESMALTANPTWRPDVPLQGKSRVNVSNYGLDTFGDLFTQRQLLALSTFSDLVAEAHEKVRSDAIASGRRDDAKPLHQGGTGALAYADAVAVYLACVVDRMAYYGSSLNTWLPKDNALRDCMPRQALAMTWEYAEANPLGKSSGDVTTCVNAVSNYLDITRPNAPAFVRQGAAQKPGLPGKAFIISTDPPYYDNVSYADLSDFFYVWLRRSLRHLFPDLFATLEVPKAEELVATPYRHGGKSRAEAFFLAGMTEAMRSLAERCHPAFPVTIYYAFKQSESEDDAGVASTGWETFLDAVIRAGFAITGTWPLRTEGTGRLLANATNALASSIVLVCRPRVDETLSASRREFVTALREELPIALTHLQRGNIAPVDLAQAAIGPGMAVYTRYARVLDAEGKPLTVRDALAIINETLDQALAQQEGEFDAESRWAITWFEQIGFAEGSYGVAEQLSKSKNTSIAGMVETGIIESKRGKVRLLKPNEMSADWDAYASRYSAWVIVHNLIRALAGGGEVKAAELVVSLGSNAEIARDLAYRLYTICERKKRATDALAYNSLVQSWSEIGRLSRENTKQKTIQADLFEDLES